jgi:type III pantothenate kinase
VSGDCILALDVGNTNTVLGLHDGERWVEHWRVETHAKTTTDEVGVLYLSLLQARGVDPGRVREAIVSCVVPPAVHANRRACQRYFGVEATFVGPETDTGLEIAYQNPADVGADRIVNGVAAHALVSGACIVVDFGTATTFDVITRGGVYLGGVIAPGIGISLEALYQRAAKLPRVSIVRPERVLGTHTVESMQSGIVYGYAGLVDGIVERLRKEIDDDDVTVIATGGLAGLISQDTSHISRVEPFLTLDGLRMVAERLSRRSESEETCS